MPDNQPTTPAASAPAESAATQPAVQSPQERLREINAGIEQGIQNLFQSERYTQDLRTMSHFHRYSLNNTMLIYMQKPDATLVASYDKRKDQFGRHANRGEKGIKIIAPVPYTVKQTREKRDPQTRAVLLDASGQAQTEEVEVRLTHYRVVPVFDVSQTDGKPLPTIVNDLQGNVEHFDAFMEAVFRASPVPIEITSIDSGADGFFSPSQQQINIREGMSEVQTVSAVMHEIIFLSDLGFQGWIIYASILGLRTLLAEGQSPICRSASTRAGTASGGQESIRRTGRITSAHCKRNQRRV